MCLVETVGGEGGIAGDVGGGEDRGGGSPGFWVGDPVGAELWERGVVVSWVCVGGRRGGEKARTYPVTGDIDGFKHGW